MKSKRVLRIEAALARPKAETRRLRNQERGSAGSRFVRFHAAGGSLGGSIRTHSGDVYAVSESGWRWTGKEKAVA